MERLRSIDSHGVDKCRIIFETKDGNKKTYREFLDDLLVEVAELSLESLIDNKEAVLYSLLKYFDKYTLVRFEFSESMECDLNNLKDKAPRLYKYLEDGYEYFVNRLDGGEFLEMENEVYEEVSEVEDIVMDLNSSMEEVLDIDFDELVYEYAMELFFEFQLKENLESLLKGGLIEDYVRVLKCLKTQLDSEERSTYEKVLGVSFRRQIVECELTDEYKVLLKDIYSEVFEMEFEVELELNEQAFEGEFVAPNHFSIDGSCRMSESDIVDFLEKLDAEFLKNNSERIYYKLSFEGGVFTYSYNYSKVRGGGLRNSHFISSLKSHPNSLELLSRKDADKICAAYENIGYDVTYK